MKKLALTFGLLVAGMLHAQYTPHQGYDNNYYGDYYDDFDYFPDDYYYEYPSDYYADSYYRNIYNDYRRSITMINWNSFFRTHHLSPMQINMIIELNRQFPSFHVWNSYYRMNPRRWWYDRFYALERILGPQVFIVFQNNYYHGSHPVYYYSNYWTTHYYPRYTVMPRYRTVHVDYYRINRYDYHRSTGTKFGWNQPRSTRTYTNFSDANHNPRSGSVSGFKNDYTGNSSWNAPKSNGVSGFKNEHHENSSFGEPRNSTANTPRTPNGGFRNDSSNGSASSVSTPRNHTTTPPRSTSGGFRNNSGSSFSTPRNSGFSNSNTRTMSNDTGIRNSSSGSGRVSGFK